MKFNELEQILRENGQNLLDNPFNSRVKNRSIEKIYSNFKDLSETELKEFLEIIQDEILETNIEEETVSVPLVNFLITAFINNSDQEISNKIRVLRVLLKSKSQESIDGKLYPYGNNALELAIASDSLDMVEFLVEEKLANPEQSLEYALDYAVSIDLEGTEEGKQFAILQYLIGKIDVKQIDSQIRRHILEIFVKNNIKLDEKMLDLGSPLFAFIVASQGDIEAIKLLSKKINLNKIEDANKEKLVHYASRFGKVEMLKYLVNELGADINAVAMLGKTAAHIAAEEGQVQVMTLLKELKADINAITRSGKNLLHISAENGQASILARLIKDLHFEVDCLDQQSKTPIHYAAEKGQVQALIMLQKLGADINAQDKDGKTPLHYAMEIGDVQILNILQKMGAKPHIQDKNGKTAFSDLNQDLELMVSIIEKGDLRFYPDIFKDKVNVKNLLQYLEDNTNIRHAIRYNAIEKAYNEYGAVGDEMAKTLSKLYNQIYKPDPTPLKLNRNNQAPHLK